MTIGRFRRGFNCDGFWDDTLGTIDVNRPWSAGTAERRRAWLAHQHTGNADVLGGEWQKGELACPLQGNVQRPLVGCTCAGLAARLNLAAFGEEAP